MNEQKFEPLHLMKLIYLILAAMMLLCLAPMPYGYYVLVRFVAMVVFGVMALLLALIILEGIFL